MMDVSVIIPVYNTLGYLEQCVGSILGQEGVSLQVILVDDGSTDGSAELCDQLAAAHEAVTVLHIPNSGPATAKNRGLDLACGEWVAMLDSDDSIMPTMLGEMLAAGEAHQADVVCCNYRQQDEAGRVEEHAYTYRTHVLDHDAALIHLLSKRMIWSQCWTKLYRRCFLLEHGIRNDDGLMTEEDHIFNLRVFTKSQRCVVVDKPLYLYTHRSQSLAHAYFRQRMDRFIENRLRRIRITEQLLQGEHREVREYGCAYNLMYYNELLGKAAALPGFHHDVRLAGVHRYMRRHAAILWRHRQQCGLSRLGILALLLLPASLYLRYRAKR